MAAEDIHQYVGLHAANDLAIVCCNMDICLEAGIVQKCILGNSKILFEWIGAHDHHHHHNLPQVRAHGAYQPLSHRKVRVRRRIPRVNRWTTPFRATSSVVSTTSGVSRQSDVLIDPEGPAALLERTSLATPETEEALQVHIPAVLDEGVPPGL